MKIKLDENFGTRGASLLRDRGFEVATVAEQDLCSVADPTLIEVCRVEERWLISFDTDFANTLRFPPRRYKGIAVLRLHEPVSLSDIENALLRIATLAGTRNPTGRLWIVSVDRIREYAEREGD